MITVSTLTAYQVMLVDEHLIRLAAVVLKIVCSLGKEKVAVGICPLF